MIGLGPAYTKHWELELVGRAKGHRQESKLAPKKHVRPSAFCLWEGWARGWSHCGSYLGTEILA